MITSSSQHTPEGISFETLNAVLNRYCMFLTKSNWDAEDLAQDTWVKAICQLKGSGHMNPEALLLRIARNTWIDQTRRKTVFSQILRREQPKATVIVDDGSIEMETAFQALMKHLSPLQRTVFLLRDVFGYSVAETAEALESTEGAVKAALHRARQALRAVKEDLETGVLPAPQEERVKFFLRALAASYVTGEIATVVELAQRNEADAAVIGRIPNKLHRTSVPIRRNSTLSMAKMAA